MQETRGRSLGQEDSLEKEMGSIPGSGRFPGEGNGRSPEKGRAWLPTPVLLPGESHGQRSLAGWAAVHGVTDRDSDNTLTFVHEKQRGPSHCQPSVWPGPPPPSPLGVPPPQGAPVGAAPQMHVSGVRLTRLYRHLPIEFCHPVPHTEKLRAAGLTGVSQLGQDTAAVGRRPR